MNLADEVKSALLDREGIYADALQVIESYELGLWESATEQAAVLGVPPEKLPELFAEALSWAEEQIPTGKARLSKAS